MKFDQQANQCETSSIDGKLTYEQNIQKNNSAPIFMNYKSNQFSSNHFFSSNHNQMHFSNKSSFHVNTVEDTSQKQYMPSKVPLLSKNAQNTTHFGQQNEQKPPTVVYDQQENNEMRAKDVIQKQLQKARSFQDHQNKYHSKYINDFHNNQHFQNLQPSLQISNNQNKYRKRKGIQTKQHDQKYEYDDQLNPQNRQIFKINNKQMLEQNNSDEDYQVITKDDKMRHSLLGKHLVAQENQHFQTPPKTSEASDQHFHTPFEASEPKWKTKPKLTTTFKNRSRRNMARATDILEASKSSKSSQDSQHNNSKNDGHNSNNLSNDAAPMSTMKTQDDKLQVLKQQMDTLLQMDELDRSQQAHNANQSRESNCSQSSNRAKRKQFNKQKSESDKKKVQRKNSLNNGKQDQDDIQDHDSIMLGILQQLKLESDSPPKIRQEQSLFQNRSPTFDEEQSIFGQINYNENKAKSQIIMPNSNNNAGDYQRQNSYQQQQYQQQQQYNQHQAQNMLYQMSDQQSIYSAQANSLYGQMPLQQQQSMMMPPPELTLSAAISINSEIIPQFGNFQNSQAFIGSQHVHPQQQAFSTYADSMLEQTHMSVQNQQNHQHNYNYQQDTNNKQPNDQLSVLSYDIDQGSQINAQAEHPQAFLANQMANQQEFGQMNQNFLGGNQHFYEKPQDGNYMQQPFGLQQQQASQAYQINNSQFNELQNNHMLHSDYSVKQFNAPGELQDQIKEEETPIKSEHQKFMESQMEKIGFKSNDKSAFKLNQQFMAKTNTPKNNAQKHQNIQGYKNNKSIPHKSHKIYKSQDTGSNRLLEMTQNIQNNFENINKYKRAREQVLDQIKTNPARQNYINIGRNNASQQQQASTHQSKSNNEEQTIDNDSPASDAQEIGLGSGGEYVLRQNQIIISPENVKYKIVDYIGQGTFGQVVKCVNLQTKTEHAIKIIKNKSDYTIQGLVEIKILHKILNDPNISDYEKKHLILMQDYFVFRDYLCIVFELLDKTLYDVISSTAEGLPLDHVREYTRQILEALVPFKNLNLIHCDLKPENILLTKDGCTLKLVDFGSAAFNQHQVYTYIQSRYYRAPEVLLGSFRPDSQTAYGNEIKQTPNYNQSIDMWSLGCTAIELFIKTPIFPGKYDYDQMLKIMEFCGLPPMYLIHYSLNRDRFFKFNPYQQQYDFKTYGEFVMSQIPQQYQHFYEPPQKYHPFYTFPQLLEQWYIMKLKNQKQQFLQSQGIIIQNINEVPLDYGVNERQQIFRFIDFVLQILQIDPDKRLTPLQALSHPFITGVSQVPLPFRPAQDIELQQIRNNQIQYYQMLNQNFQKNQNQQNNYNIQESINKQASVTANQKSGKQINMSKLLSQAKQVNGSESFRPPINSLDEKTFHGFCFDTLSEFYQESRIQFQIHQQTLIEEIELQKTLLNSYQFCDANILEDYEIDEDYLQRYQTKAHMPMKLMTQKSIIDIQNDKSIIHPKKQLLKDNPQKFIKDIIQKEIMDKLDPNKGGINTPFQKNQSHPKDEGGDYSDLLNSNNKNSIEFQLQHFEDFFICSDEDRFKFSADLKFEDFDDQTCPNSSPAKSNAQAIGQKGAGGGTRQSPDAHFLRNELNFYGLSAFDDAQRITSSKQSENLKKDIQLFRREKERSGSSDTFQLKQTSPENEDMQTDRKGPRTISSKEGSKSGSCYNEIIASTQVKLQNQQSNVTQEDSNCKDWTGSSKAQLDSPKIIGIGKQGLDQKFESPDDDSDCDAEQDTEYDTNEMRHGSSNNNSFETQERMLGHPAEGGIKCLRTVRAKNKQQKSSTKQSTKNAKLDDQN